MTHLSTLAYERLSKNSAGTLAPSVRNRTMAGEPMRICAFSTHAPVFFPRPPRPLRRDYEGEELTDKHAAWREATVTAGQILQGLDGALTPAREWRMVVTDEFQNPLFVLHISAARPK
jgi:hypothetical protein